MSQTPNPPQKKKNLKTKKTQKKLKIPLFKKPPQKYGVQRRISKSWRADTRILLCRYCIVLLGLGTWDLEFGIWDGMGAGKIHTWDVALVLQKMRRLEVGCL
jgi:hypothetical protein